MGAVVRKAARIVKGVSPYRYKYSRLEAYQALLLADPLTLRAARSSWLVTGEMIEFSMRHPGLL